MKASFSPIKSRFSVLDFFYIQCSKEISLCHKLKFVNPLNLFIFQDTLDKAAGELWWQNKKLENYLKQRSKVELAISEMFLPKTKNRDIS